jgi:hypothetical protein
VLSHHGQLEFGSPKVPMFPEALLLHYIDDMDSKMENMRALIDRDPQAEGYFTAYSSALARVALRKARYLENTPRGASAPADNDIHNSNIHNSNAYSVTAANSTTQSHQISSIDPASSVHLGGAPPAPPNSNPAPVAHSLFGAKLQQALDDERK